MRGKPFLFLERRAPVKDTRRIKVRDTDGEEFSVYADWDGAVIRGGKIFREPLPAKLWRVGDTVQCLFARDGEILRPVRFTIAFVQLEQKPPEGSQA